MNVMVGDVWVASSMKQGIWVDTPELAIYNFTINF